MKNKIMNKYCCCIIQFLNFSIFFQLLGLSQITIIEPDSIIDKLKSPYIFGSTATFGIPYYGSRLLGKVQYFDTKGCSENDYTLENSTLATIVAIRREDCPFINKTEVAEKKGAKAILIIDSKHSNSSYKDVRRVIMSKGNSNAEIKIPALLIGEIEGNAIINAFEANKEIILELSWSMPKFDWVEMDLWVSIALNDSLQFIEDFYPYAMELKDKIDFFPHYWVVSLNQFYKDKCWDEEGFFCSLNADWNDEVNGRQILEETVRQICLYENTVKGKRFFSEEWWKYMANFKKKCGTKNLSEKCSFSLMKEIGANISSIKNCYDERAISILSNERFNEAWSPMAALINGWHFSGSLEANTVVKAVCTGFKDQPDECTKILNNKFPEKESVKNSNGMGTFTIILISLVASSFIIFIITLIFWKLIYPNFRKNMQYALMKEVQSELQKQNNGLINLDKRGIGNPCQFSFHS